MYLDRNKILSYNASLNFIVLKRGYGKSWTFKDLIISDFIKSGAKTVWVRRYKPELRKAITKFLPDIIDRYSKHKIEIKGKAVHIDGKEAINFYTLSEAQDLKSMSFEGYKYLIFDEFIIEGGAKRYLPEECDVFCSLLSTVFRDRPIKAFLLGNKVKAVTPYNIYFNLPNFEDVKYIKDRNTLVYAKDNDGVIEENYAKSDLDKVLKGTKYYDYSMLNNTLNDNSSFIEKRPKDLTTNLVLNINGIDVGLFFDTNKSKLYFDIKCDKTIRAKYTLNKDNMAESYMLLSKQFPMAKLIKNMYVNGRVFFNDIRTKTIVQDLLDFIV